jgi:hypothetical protein
MIGSIWQIGDGLGGYEPTRPVAEIQRDPGPVTHRGVDAMPHAASYGLLKTSIAP